MGSVAFFLYIGQSIPIIEGSRSLQGALKSQIGLAISAIIFIIGVIIFFIGKSKVDDFNNLPQ